MKRIIFFAVATLFVLTPVFTNGDVAVPGCNAGDKFSSINGAPCPTAECPLGAVYNIKTGQLCPSNPYANQSNDGLTGICTVDNSQTYVNRSVTWTVAPSGGSGQYSYSWSGTDNQTGSNSTLSASYATSGVKHMQVVVTAGGVGSLVTCPDVSVTEQPLVAACSLIAQHDPAGVKVTWNVSTGGGSGATTISWSGTDNLYGTVNSVDKTYITGGSKYAVATVVSGDQTRSVTCGVTFPDLTYIPSDFTGSCRPVVSGMSVDWSSAVSGAGATYTYQWSGSDGFSSNASAASMTYSMPGSKLSTVNISSSAIGLSFECDAIIADQLTTTSSCFIATAAFGTPMQPEVQVLRNFRDDRLLTNPVGKAFVDTYYKLSPPVADYIRNNDDLKAVVREILKPVIFVATKIETP